MKLRSKLISIEDTKGVLIPSPLLQLVGIEDEVELEAHNGKIIMRPIRPRRKDWDTAFKEMAAQDHDVLLDDTLSSSEWDQAH